MAGPITLWRQLRAKGVMGINQRNADFILKYNRRRHYPLVDNKILTKARAIGHGLNVPEQYAVVKREADIAGVREVLANHDDFVIKPAHGAAGEGIVVISGRFDDYYRTVSGRLLRQTDIDHHFSNILTGMYSLGGASDQALVEYRVKPDPVFKAISFAGVPDIRIIVFRGYPVMAMVRLPTQQSQGKANLHQGAIGVGVDLASGETLHGSWMNSRITQHPDTFEPVDGIRIEQWDDLLHQAAGCYELCQLGYIGVDLVLDETKGPMMLEINARPGLNIQIANNTGLLLRTDLIEAHIAQLGKAAASQTVAERVAFAKTLVSANA